MKMKALKTKIVKMKHKYIPLMRTKQMLKMESFMDENGDWRLKFKELLYWVVWGILSGKRNGNWKSLWWGVITLHVFQFIFDFIFVKLKSGPAQYRASLPWTVSTKNLLKAKSLKNKVKVVYIRSNSYNLILAYKLTRSHQKYP